MAPHLNEPERLLILEPFPELPSAEVQIALLEQYSRLSSSAHAQEISREVRPEEIPLPKPPPDEQDVLADVQSKNTTLSLPQARVHQHETLSPVGVPTSPTQVDLTDPTGSTRARRLNLFHTGANRHSYIVESRLPEGIADLQFSLPTESTIKEEEDGSIFDGPTSVKKSPHKNDSHGSGPPARGSSFNVMTARVPDSSKVYETIHSAKSKATTKSESTSDHQGPSTSTLSPSHGQSDAIDAMVLKCGGNLALFHQEDEKRRSELRAILGKNANGLQRAASTPHHFTRPQKAQKKAQEVPSREEQQEIARQEHIARERQKTLDMLRGKRADATPETPSPPQPARSGFRPPPALDIQLATDLARRNTVVVLTPRSAIVREDFASEPDAGSDKELSEIDSSGYSLDINFRDSDFLDDAEAVKISRVSQAPALITIHGPSSKANTATITPAATNEGTAQQADMPGYSNSNVKRSRSSPKQIAREKSESNLRFPIRRANTTMRASDDAAAKLRAKKLAAAESANYDARAPQREHSKKIAERLDATREEAEAAVAAAEADSKKMKTTPYPHELARLVEEAAMEKRRKKLPSFWW
ncbi:hypothetical protein Micbo1qcDRAFT_178929 [Microdochium bolleyi]|uniref:Uncharacterized protein n=1 Tax=Microdochium bolleyi TaxID=196109 RepID=A0A136IRS3_9PEZI|nr:hypothetical protein Micbo1qcDRAFT_178929 [Microdochium bolleyi]